MEPMPHARTPRRPSQALVLAAAIAMLLPACALFKPQRVTFAEKVTETLPPEAVAPSAGPTGGGSGPTTRFIPGKAAPEAAGSCRDIRGVDGISDGVIRLGTIQPMDGPAAQVGKPLHRTTLAYVNYLNARGGIAGCRVELHLQTACLNCVAENKLAAQTLVEQKHVFAIVNTYMNTYAFDAAIKYLNEKQVPLIEGWSGVGDESIVWGAQQTPWSVYYTIRNDTAVLLWADFLDRVLDEWQKAGKLQNRQNPRWVATVALDVSQDRRRSAEFKRVWEARGRDYRVTTQQYVAAEEETVTRMDSFVAAMRDSDANGVFSASNITMLFGMQAAQRQSWKVPWVTKSAWGRALTDNCGSACNGGFTDNNGWGWGELTTPQMDIYMQTMRRYYPDGARYADAQTLGGWIGMIAFDYAASQLGAGLTRQGLIDILGNLRNFQTGVGAPITTSPEDHLGMREFMMLQVCRNRFWRVTDWIGAGDTIRRVNQPGNDCGWGW